MFGRKKNTAYEMDMTSGGLLPKILVYSGPLVLTGILQLLYNAADVVVIGRFASNEALAAVTSTGSLINLLVNVFMGLSVGANVVIARDYGARNAEGVHRAEHTAVALACVMGFAVGAAGFFLARPLLELMDSPEDVIDGAALYVKIYFLGMPANMLYNFGAATLRAVGDTKRPLYYLTVSGIVNVALNLFLVIVCRMDVAGVAIATVTSQVISAVLVLGCLLRSDGDIRLDPKKLRIHKRELKDIARVGLPAGVQGSLFSVSNVLIQSSVNSFGSLVVAGNGIASNAEGFVYTAMNAQYQAALTFASQNYGAGKNDRVRRVMWLCLGAVIVIGFGMGMLFLLCGESILGLYNSDARVIAYGMNRLQVILPYYFLCGMMDVMVGQLRGIGYSVMPMIVSLTGACLLRIVWIFTVFAAEPTQYMLYVSYPVSWAATFSAHMACYLAVRTRKLPVRKAGAV
ncbi:MAG: MATE family efflux transporter [Clostridia bacterium]|nr:MATE family efflux transporter [Clostridia bacterium]